EPDGENMVTLSGKDDSFGPFGSLLALTEDRAIFIRSASYGDMGTVHSALLDGTSRLQLLPENKIRSWDPFGVSSNGRLVYRMEGNGTPSTVRLYSMRVDSVISPGVPDQVILSHDPTSQLTFLLP